MLRLGERLSVSVRNGKIVFFDANQNHYVELDELQARSLGRWLLSPAHRSNPVLWGDGSAPPEKVIQAQSVEED